MLYLDSNIDSVSFLSSCWFSFLYVISHLQIEAVYSSTNGLKMNVFLLIILSFSLPWFLNNILNVKKFKVTLFGTLFFVRHLTILLSLFHTWMPSSIFCILTNGVPFTVCACHNCSLIGVLISFLLKNYFVFIYEYVCVFGYVHLHTSDLRD